MEENKKSKLGLGILIGVLATLVVGLSGFIIYDKVLSSNDSNQQENDNKVESDDSDKDTDEGNDSSENNLKEISDSDKKIILDKIESYNYAFISNYPINDFKKFSNSISNQEKLDFLFGKTGTSYGESFTKNDLALVASKYFYDDFSYTNENILCFLDGCGSYYNYNKKTGIYTLNENHPGHGGEGSYRDKVYFVDGFYDTKNNEYVINTKILYGDYCDVCGPLQKVYDSNSRDNIIYDYIEDGADGINISQAYESVKDKLPITTYRFIKNSSNEIVLKSVTVE